MDLTLIYTVLFILIIVIGGVIGLIRGGIKMCFRLVGTGLCLIGAFILAQKLGSTIYEKALQDTVHDAVGQAIVQVSDKVSGVTANIVDNTGLGDVADKVDDIANGLSSDVLSKYDINIDLKQIDIMDMLNSLEAETDNDIISSALGMITDNTDILTNIVSDMKKSDKTVVDYLCEDVIDPVGVTVVKIVTFLVLFILLQIIVTILVNLLDKVIGDSMLGGVNRVIGLVIGSVIGLVAAYIVAMGICVLSDMNVKTDYFNRVYVEDSAIGKLLVDFDITKAYAEANTWYSEIVGNMNEKEMEVETVEAR